MMKGDILGTYFDSNAAAFQRGLQYHSVLALLDQLQGGAVLAAGHRAVLDRDLDVVAGLHHEASLSLGGDSIGLKKNCSNVGPK